MATNANANAPAAAAAEVEPEATEAESNMTDVIAKDRPAIDAAVKSFISMVCARSMAASNTDSTHDKVMMGIIPAIANTLSISSSNNNNSNNNKNNATVIAIGSTNKDDNQKDSSSGSSSSTTTSPISSTTTTTIIPIQQQILQLARLILKAVNSYTFPIHDTVAYSMAEKPGTSDPKKEELLEISVVARLWNGLVQSEQKPSRFLGRRSLKLAWKNLDIAASLLPEDEGEDEDESKNESKDDNKNDSDSDNNVVTTIVKSDADPKKKKNNNQQQQRQPQQQKAISVRERQLEWLQQFEALLFLHAKPLPSDMKVDDDSALLWAVDGGAAELAKRRQRRIDAAKERGPSTPS